MRFVLRGGGDCERNAAGRDGRDAGFVEQERWDVAGSGDFDAAAGVGTAGDEGGELAGDGALAKNLICRGQKFFERLADGGERAEHGVKLGHEHRGGYAFARDIADEEEHFVRGIVRKNQIAIIAADEACRLVVVGDIPSGNCGRRLRKQAVLDLMGELEIVFEEAALRGGEMIEADAQRGIGKERIRFDAAVAFLAYAEGALLEAIEGAIDFGEKAGDFAIGLRGGRERE